MSRTLLASVVVADVPASVVTGFQIRHVAGQPLALDVEIGFDSYQPIAAIVGKPARLDFGHRGGEPRAVFGIVTAARVVGTSAKGSEKRATRWKLRIVSRLALLAGSVTSRIFQDKSAKDVVSEVLTEHGIDKVEWRLVGAPLPVRDNCVQYQESDLAFVSRLLEHEGVYSFVEGGDEGEILVFADDSTVAAPMPGDPELVARPRSGMSDEHDGVYVVKERQRVRSGKFVLRDYDFQRPALDLTSTAAGARYDRLEVYDYPGEYVEPSDGERLAKVRLEEASVEAEVVEIEAVCARLAVGQKLTLSGTAELDADYFVFAVEHDYQLADTATGARPPGGASTAGAGRRGGGTAGARYVVRARLLPIATRFRPARRTARPIIAGPQTATVVAPAGSAGESIHTDEHARCKVKFHWDRSEAVDDKASAWVRVAQLQTSGSMMLPRIGWEVIVEFLEGNPDRPVISGRFYNGANMPPYALPEGKTRTAVRTASTPGGGGSNEIRFEDKAGSEEVMIHAQYDMKVAVANNAKTTVGKNETRVVKNNAQLGVGGGQKTKITKGNQGTVGGSQTVTVGGDRSVEVNAVAALTAHGDASTSVGGDQFEMDGNPLEAMLALAAQAAAEFATAMANNAIATVKGQVDGAINQVMGPVNQLNAQAEQLGASMQAVAGGDLSGVAGMAGAATGIPGAGQMAASMAAPPAGGDGGGGAPPGPPGAPSPAAQANAAIAGQGNALQAMAQGAASQAIARGAGMAQGAIADALGLGGSGSGGGASGANAAGPAGDVPGIDATDRAKGPGHSIAKVGGAHEETVGTAKVTAALTSIDTNVTGAASIKVGAATLQLCIGNYAEKVQGSKSESALGLVVLSKAGESETIAGSKDTKVGGAIIDKLKGSHTVQASGDATFIGAFHKFEAKTAIVFKCGGSTLTITSGGVTLESPMVTFMAPKIQLPKKVTEV
ncbi:MAG: type VI secretion system tip protein TssI/VgrG [Polyangiaceae bacterium]